MHTSYHKISARERDTAPRYYYKRTKTYTCLDRIKNFFRAIIAFFFTQVGVFALLVSYMVFGAHLFSSLEAKSQMECAEVAEIRRNTFTRDLWNITMRTNVLFGEEWRLMTKHLLLEFQNDTVNNVRNGYTGNDVGDTIWTFSAAMMFSLTVFTTIGKLSNTKSRLAQFACAIRLMLECLYNCTHLSVPRSRLDLLCCKL